jgi:hypothetical protein
MTEGTVVIIVGKRDERVRQHQEGELYGTVVKVEHGKVWVMLPDGDLWVGEDYQVYPKQEEEECTTN